MLALLVIVVLSLVAAGFATQNTQTASIILANYKVSLPIYVVVLGALFLGIFLSWIISLFNSVFSFLAIHGKDASLKESKKEVMR